MVQLIQLTPAQFCPACAELGKEAYLRRIMTEEEANHIMNHTVHYECSRCFALFEVKEDEL